jgi:LPXTG-motif cell wall-anchored protein
MSVKNCSVDGAWADSAGVSGWYDADGNRHAGSSAGFVEGQDPLSSVLSGVSAGGLSSAGGDGGLVAGPESDGVGVSVQQVVPSVGGGWKGLPSTGVENESGIAAAILVLAGLAGIGLVKRRRNC